MILEGSCDQQVDLIVVFLINAKSLPRKIWLFEFNWQLSI